MALLSGFPARGPLAACLNALRLYQTDSLGHGRHPGDRHSFRNGSEPADVE